MKTMLVKVALAAAAMFAASPAMAQATRTWISGVGDDVNPCSRTAPCKTFAGAISKTAAGGEINALDPGPYGAVTITKPITLRGGGQETGVLATLGSNGIIINITDTATYPNAKVVIDGLDLEGAGTGLNGIRILAARDVEIIDTTIRGFAAAGGASISIAGSGQTRVTIDRVRMFNSEVGVSVAPSAGFTNSVKVSNSLIATTANAGIRLNGPLANGYIYATVIVGTTKSLDLIGGAVMSSYGNNALNGTTTDAPTPTPTQ